MSSTSSSSPIYAVATGLIGFRSSELRVRVTRMEYGEVWCVTADLADAGTPLTVSASQVIFEEPVTVLFHKDGLVAFA